MTDTTAALITAHLDAWNTDQGAERDRSISTIYAPGVTVNEPEAVHTGHEGVSEAISGVRALAPGAVIARSGPVQSAQDLTTYVWDLALPDGTRVASGRDVLIIRNGVIQSLYVVLDAP